jgi:hypothetical protein
LHHINVCFLCSYHGVIVPLQLEIPWNSHSSRIRLPPSQSATTRAPLRGSCGCCWWRPPLSHLLWVPLLRSLQVLLLHQSPAVGMALGSQMDATVGFFYLDEHRCCCIKKKYVHKSASAIIHMEADERVKLKLISKK